MMIILKDGDPSPQWEGGGELPYDRGGMLVASLRGVNFIFWFQGCSGQNNIIFSGKGLF